VRQLEHANRRQQERAGQPLAEQLDARVALRHVAQHPGHDPPALEARAVRRHRPLVAGARGDVGVRLPGHPLARLLLEPLGVGRHARPRAADAPYVDRCLALDAAHGRSSIRGL
jgi:hypothetical protein